MSVTSCQISRSSTIRRFASLGPTQIGIFCNRSRIACRFTFTSYRITCGSSILDTTTKRPLRPRRKKTACRVEPAFITGIKLHVNSSHRDVPRNRILSGAIRGNFVWLAKRTGQSKFAPFRARAHTSNSIPMAELPTIRRKRRTRRRGTQYRSSPKIAKVIG